MTKIEYICTYHLGRTRKRYNCDNCGVKVRYFAGYWLDILTDDTDKPCREWKDGLFLCHTCSLNKLGTPQRKKKRAKVITLFGIPVTRLRELIDLFNNNGYNLKSKDDWARIKLDFFGILRND